MTIKVNHKQLVEVARTCYEKRVPLYIWGTMGIGKSSVVKEFSKELANEMKLEFLEAEADGEEKFSFIDVRLSQLEPSDLRGIPTIDKDNKQTIWYIPKWLPSNPKSKGILFFDELNLSPPSIQASAYQLILDRKIGDYKLPDGWVIFSAGNTSEDKANIFDIPKPLANRFVHINLEKPNREDWVKWALENGIETDICMYIENHPSALHNFNKNDKSEAFATPRTWEYCSKLIKDNKSNEDIFEILVASAVGEGLAHEFITFVKLKKKIDVAELLKNPIKAKEIKDIDLKYSLISVLTDKYRENPKLLNDIFGICEYMESEFAILLLRYVSTIGKGKFVSEAVKSKKWLELSKQYGKFLND